MLEGKHKVSSHKSHTLYPCTASPVPTLLFLFSCAVLLVTVTRLYMSKNLYSMRSVSVVAQGPGQMVPQTTTQVHGTGTSHREQKKGAARLRVVASQVPPPSHEGDSHNSPTLHFPDVSRAFCQGGRAGKIRTDLFQDK